MNIIEAFLDRNCTVEQSSMLIECFRTIRGMGLVEIDYNLDELFQRIEHLETFDIIQNCYAMVARLQRLAFDALEIEVDVDDISHSNELLNYITMIEESDQSEFISGIIDNAEAPHDAFIALLEQVCFTSLTHLEPIIKNVTTAFIERVYTKHHSNLLDNMQIDTPIKPVDERILTILKSLWNVREFRPIKNYVLDNGLNLPIPDNVLKEQFKDHMLEISTQGNKKAIASQLLELTLVSDVEYKNIKPKLKSFAKDFYGKNLLCVSELTYQIDNICMENKINGSY